MSGGRPNPVGQEKEQNLTPWWPCPARLERGRKLTGVRLGYTDGRVGPWPRNGWGGRRNGGGGTAERLDSKRKTKTWPPFPSVYPRRSPPRGLPRGAPTFRRLLRARVRRVQPGSPHTWVTTGRTNVPLPLRSRVRRVLPGSPHHAPRPTLTLLPRISWGAHLRPGSRNNRGRLLRRPMRSIPLGPRGTWVRVRLALGGPG